MSGRVSKKNLALRKTALESTLPPHNVRFTVKMSKYKVVFEDVVFIDTKRKQGLINPLLDTEWNFSKFHAFFSSVLNAASKRI